MKTLEEARCELMLKLKDGTNCPCCGGWAQKYKRNVYGTIVVVMAKLYRISRLNPSREFFHLDEFVTDHHGVSFSILAFWGLVERMPKSPKDKHKKTSGMWRITAMGVDFLEGRIRIPKSAWIYNDTLIEFSEETCDVKESLESGFNYQELMSGI